MRRPAAAVGVLWAACACVGDGSGGRHAANAAAALSELAWIAPEADKVRILTESLGECLRPPEDAEAAYLVEIGRAAFSSPLLFGGPAARGGLSCASCHPGGRRNETFFLKGLSGAPGTADVTSSLFSKTREDGRFNPVAIPTLVGVAGKDVFGAQTRAPSLHAFIESAVVEEFQGAPPPDAVLKGLAVYVAHFDEAACEDGPRMRSARADLADAARAAEAASAALARGDAAAADFLIVSTQSAIGRVHERFGARDFDLERRALTRLSRDLGAVRLEAQERPDAARQSLGALSRAIDAAGETLEKVSAGSLYDAAVLRAALPSGAPAQ